MDLGFSKEEVHARLLRTAAEMWGLHPSQFEAIDPMARMLLGATAKEIEKIGNELHDSDTRIFNRIAQYLLPDVMLRAEPAHGVVKLAPMGPQQVTRYEEMAFERSVRNRENLNKIETRELGFSAAGDHALTGARIAFRVHGTELCAVEGLRLRDLAEIRSACGPGVIYLGLAGATEAVGEVTLYFDWLNDPARDRCHQALAKITAQDIHGASLSIAPGLGGDASVRDARRLIDPSAGIEERVRAYYDDRFVRIHVPALPIGSPPGVEQAFAQARIAGVEDIRWLRLDLPSDLSAQQVREALVLDNCVPVLNRSLGKAIFRLQKDLNIKRLETDGFFLQLEKAESGSGKRYAEVPSLDLVDVSRGSYTLRFGVAGRFDARDGSQLLDHVLDLLKEEKRAFSAMDVASTTTDLKTIEQTIEKVRKRIGGQLEQSDRPYITLKPFEESETAHVYYWTTDGVAANNIPVGSPIRCKHPALAPSGSALLVSSAVGAKDARTPKELVQRYKAAVLSRGTIVTRQDIIEHCKAVCGVDLEHVAVMDGVTLSPDPGKGLMRCLEVVLTFRPFGADGPDTDELRKRIRADLNTSAGLSLPVRVR